MRDWTTWHGNGTPDLPPMTPVRPKYRGPANPVKGVRMVIGPVSRLDWSHDGGPDDIVAYQVEEVEGA